jgi:hypothetical protein
VLHSMELRSNIGFVQLRRMTAVGASRRLHLATVEAGCVPNQ